MSDKKQNLIVEIFTILSMVIIICGISLFGGYYINNDDYVMRNIVSGVYTGSPDAHAIFLMYPLSFLLKTLYVITNQVPWYGLLMVGMHYLCVYLLARRSGAMFKGVVKRCVVVTAVLAIIVLLDYKYIVSNEFTVLSGIIAATAIFLVATEKEQKISNSIIVIFLLTFSMWYRLEMFEMACPFILLAYILRTYSANRDNLKLKKPLEKKYIKFFGIEAAIFLFIAVSSYVSDKVAYSSTDWNSYFEYNNARSKIFDYDWNASYDVYNAYADSPINGAQYAATERFAFSLIEDVTSEQLGDVFYIGRIEKEQWKQYYSVPRKELSDITETLLDKFATLYGAFALVLFSVTSVLCYIKKRNIFSIVCTACGLFVLAEIGYFIWRERAIARLTVPLFFFIILMLWAMLAEMIADVQNNKYTYINVGVLTVTLLLTVGTFQRSEMIKYANELKARSDLWELLTEYTLADENTIYLIDNSLVPNSFSALRENANVSTNQMLVTTWLVNSPVWHKNKSELEITSVRDALFNNENIKLVSSMQAQYEWLEMFDEADNLYCEEWLIGNTLIYSFDNED